MTRDYDADVKTLRKLFFAGFLGLPLIWLLTGIHYFKPSREQDAPPELRKLVNRVLFGVAVYAVIFCTWVILFHKYYNVWGLETTLVVPQENW